MSKFIKIKKIEENIFTGEESINDAMLDISKIDYVVYDTNYIHLGFGGFATTPEDFNRVLSELGNIVGQKMLNE